MAKARILHKVEAGITYYEFYCPGCKTEHVVNSAWGFNDDFDKPTFTPSILVNRDRINPTAPVCHSFVKEGRIQFLGDCTHELAGKTVDLPELD